ncbi:MAG: tol-pal system protein YbgF [Deltaproteobacteria bacterium]|nr:tol-pal system protein YbgF [Deltaproteobacteria bacterium]
MKVTLWRSIFLVVLLAQFGAGCKIPLDERQAVAELQKKVAVLEDELQTGAGRQQSLKQELEGLRVRFDEARDLILKQGEEIQALLRAQAVKGNPPTFANSVPATKVTGEEKPPSVPAPSSPGEVQAFEKIYNESLAAYQNGDYENAVKLFAAYLRDFPTTEKAANARYWLGESYYSLAQYAQAITEFKRVQKDFPASAKVPDALLKTAMSYEAIGSREPALAACTELLRKYPGSLSAELAEKARARLE